LQMPGRSRCRASRVPSIAATGTGRTRLGAARSRSAVGHAAVELQLDCAWPGPRSGEGGPVARRRCRSSRALALRSRPMTSGPPSQPRVIGGARVSSRDGRTSVRVSSTFQRSPFQPPCRRPAGSALRRAERRGEGLDLERAQVVGLRAQIERELVQRKPALVPATPVRCC
jgi:hypothetical protein